MSIVMIELEDGRILEMRNDLPLATHTVPKGKTINETMVELSAKAFKEVHGRSTSEKGSAELPYTHPQMRLPIPPVPWTGAISWVGCFLSDSYKRRIRRSV